MHKNILFVLVAVNLLTGCQTVDYATRSVTGLVDSIVGTDQAVATAAPTNAPTPTTISSATAAPQTQSPTKSVESSDGLVGADGVIDGDTIVLNGKRIRLYGIDAPELAQVCREEQGESPCGEIARNALIGFTAGDKVHCDHVDIDRYGRDVSRCTVSNFDLSGRMVLAGMAVAYRRYSEDYKLHETAAQTLKRGIWKGSFDMPWDWRASRKQ